MNKPIILVLFAAGFLFLHPYTACAQSVAFTGVQTTVPASGLNGPFGVAVDRAGDVFIADFFNNRVVEVPAGGGAQTTVGSGLNYPAGVAVDGAGDVFIADAGNNRVVEVPSGGGAQTTVGTGLYSPMGVAVDGAGNVFIADTPNNRVVEVPAGGGAQTTVGTGLGELFGVAVDGAGDVFIADTLNNRVVEVPAGGGAQTTVGSGLNQPTGVAVDGAGDVFIADSNNSRVVEVPAGGGAQTTVGSGLPFPAGVAVDGAGDLFIADYHNNRVVEVQLVAVNFGSVNICPGGQTTPAPCSATLTLNYSVKADTTFGSTVKVLTQGAPNLDFTLSSTTCTGTVTAGNSCTVNVQFAPLAPGLRMGAVQLTDSSANLLVTTLIHGEGQGPAMAFGPGVQTTVGSGLSNPQGVAVDGAGDVFIADTGNNRVVEVPAGGGAQTTVPAIGLNDPPGVGVDGAGDVFIADPNNNQVVEVPAGGGAQTTVGSGLYYPFGVAVDGAGDVFIADTDNSRVVKVPAGGGAQTTVGSGLNHPFGVAVDGAGDVFIADRGLAAVVEVPAGGGAQTTVGSGLSIPFGVAVDGAGDVFIADPNNNRVVEVPAGGGAQTTVGTGLSYPEGVAVDGAGDVFIADGGNNRVVEVQRSEAPTFSFAATVVFNTSTDSPQSVTVQNIGNQLLDAVSPGLSIGSLSFAQVAGPGTPADCTSSFSLAPGASCNLSISFTPQTTGSIVSAATFTDNALNATAAEQSVTLQGTGTPTPLTITASSGSMTYGGAVPTITPSYSGFVNGDTSSVVTGMTCGTTASPTSPVGSSPSTSCSGASAPSYYTIKYVNGTVTVNPATLTYTATAASRAYGTANPAFSGTVTGFVGSDNRANATTGTLAFTSPATASSGVGSYAINGSGLTAGNYTFVQAAGNATALAITPAPLLITASSATMSRGGTVPTITPLYSGLVNGDTATVPTPPTCSAPGVTSSSGAGTYATSCSGAVDPNYKISYARGTLTITDSNARVSPASLSFRNQALDTSSTSREVTLTSTGTTNLNISSITITGSNASDFTATSHCPASLAPGRRCTIDVQFTPSQTGARTAAVTITDNAASSPQTARLSGTGIVQADLSRTDVTFRARRVGTTSAPEEVTLTNNLSTHLAIASITFTGADPGDFRETNTCGRRLGAMSDCRIFVTFRPGATGTRTANLNVNDSANNSPQTVALTGTGE